MRYLVRGALLAALAMVAGCHLLIGYEDAVLGQGGSGGQGGAAGACAADGSKNGDETGVDCGGGACAACLDGEGCEVGTDCESRVCVAGTCRPPACDDGIQNGAEVNVDCGGGPTSGCLGCADGRPCHAGSDCASGVCKMDACIDYLVWIRQFGPIDESSVGADGAGNAVITGLLTGSVNLGGGPIVSAGDFDVPLARYDASGKHLWSQRFGGDGFDFSATPALDALGNVASAGYFSGTIDFGGGPLTSAGGADIFVAKLDAAGQQVWSKRFGGNQGEGAKAVAFDGSGNILVTGSFPATINFGGGALMSAGGADVFVVKLGPQGAHVWSRRFGDTQHEAGTHIAASPDGGLVIMGDLSGAVNFGGGPLAISGSNDRFLVKLSPSGDHLWSRSFPLFLVGGMRVDSSGNVIVAGSFNGTVDFGGGPLVGADDIGSISHDIAVAKLSATGAHVWSKRFGDPDYQGCSALAVDAGGNIILAGGGGGVIDFGAGPLQGPGVAIVKLDGEGNHVWSKMFHGDGSGGISIEGLAAPDAEHVVLVGNLGGTFDLGDGPMTSQSYGDLILAKFLLP